MKTLPCGVRPVEGCVGGLLRGRAWPLHGEAVSPCLYTLVLRSTQSQWTNTNIYTVTAVDTDTNIGSNTLRGTRDLEAVDI